jgi:hypothetical protein
MNDRMKIIPFGDHYAVTMDGEMVGTVEKTDHSSHWAWYPIDEKAQSVRYVPLRYAIQAAIKACNGA